MGETLFEKYGGVPTVSTIVHAFYGDVLESPLLRPFFDKVNMAGLIEHQVKFFSHLLGGPAHYQGRELRVSHMGLGIEDRHFDEVASILLQNLEDAGMEATDVKTVMAAVASVRGDIVSSASPSS